MLFSNFVDQRLDFRLESTVMIRIAMLVALTLGLSQISACAANPSGKWKGNWSSQSTGHRGPLRARIRPTLDGNYRALFAGRFAKVIPFVYPAKLTRIGGTSNRYYSSMRLPFSGQYSMTATVTGNRFEATFRSRKDRGTFRMSR